MTPWPLEPWAVESIAKLEAAIEARDVKVMQEEVGLFCHEGLSLESGVVAICSHHEDVSDGDVVAGLVRLARHCVECLKRGEGGC